MFGSKCKKSGDGEHQPYRRAYVKKNMRGYEIKCFACQKILQRWRKAK